MRKAPKLLGICVLMTVGMSCKCGGADDDKPPLDAECFVGDDSCGEGYVCEGAGPGGVGACRDMAQCRVGNDSACPEGQRCVGLGNNHLPGAPGACQDRGRGTVECHVGDTSCGEGHFCEGEALGAPGICRPLPEMPECFVGDNRCPAGKECIGYESHASDAPGTCEDIPECRVGRLPRCPHPWQQCVGDGGNNNVGAPGTCEGEPECIIDNIGCAMPWQRCVGYGGLAQPGTPGYCYGIPECLVGDDTACPTGQECIGYESDALEAPGTCEDIPECRVDSSPHCHSPWQHCVGDGGNNNVGAPGTCEGEPECIINEVPCAPWKICVGYHGNTNDGAPGTCEGEPTCYVGEGGCLLWQDCIGYASNAPGAEGYCEDNPECIIGVEGCPAGLICTGYGGNNSSGAPGSCQELPEEYDCVVGENTCPPWQTCKDGDGNTHLLDTPGYCMGMPECYVETSSCLPWQDCVPYEGHMGDEGKCVDNPECRVDDTPECPNPWQHCVGYDGNNTTGAPGTCGGTPECLVDSTHDCHNPWQHCVGYDSNEADAPGYCVGSPECLVGDGSCPPWQSCEGYFGDGPGEPGTCQGEPQCFVGDGSLCGFGGEGYVCEGLPGAPNGETGVCKDVAECRVDSPSNACETDNGYACKGIRFNEEGAAGTCEDVAECRLGSTTNVCDESDDYFCEGAPGATTGDKGSCVDKAECRVGDNTPCQLIHTAMVCVGKSHGGAMAAGLCEEDSLGKPCAVDTGCISGQVCDMGAGLCVYGERDEMGHVVATLSQFQLFVGSLFVVPLRAHGVVHNSPNAGWVGYGEAQLKVLARGPDAGEDFYVETPQGVLDTESACLPECNGSTECWWTCTLPEGWAGGAAEPEVVVGVGESSRQTWAYVRSSSPSLLIDAPSSALLDKLLTVCASATTTDAPLATLHIEEAKLWNGTNEVPLSWSPTLTSPSRVCQEALLPPTLLHSDDPTLEVSAKATDSVGNITTALYAEPLHLTGISCVSSTPSLAAVNAPLVVVNNQVVFAAGASLYFVNPDSCAPPTSMVTGTVQGPMVAIGNHLALAINGVGGLAGRQTPRLLMVNATTPIVLASSMDCATSQGGVDKEAQFEHGLALLSFNTASPLANPTATSTTPVRYVAPANIVKQGNTNNSTLIAYTPSVSNDKDRCMDGGNTGKRQALTPVHLGQGQVFGAYGEPNGNKLSIWSLGSKAFEEVDSANGVPAGILTGIALNSAGHVLLTANIATAMYSLRLWQNFSTPLYASFAVYHFSAPALDSLNRVYAVGYLNNTSHALYLISADLQSILSSIALPSAATNGIVGSPLLAQSPAGHENETEIYVVGSNGHVFGFQASPSGVLRHLWTVDVGFAISPSAQPVLTKHSERGGSLWVVGAQGQVRGIRVDGEGLNKTAAWPKAFRDNCNTGSRLVTPTLMPGCF